jgi:diacylglycerol kinase (ATP)
MISFKKLIKGFAYAAKGIVLMVRSEQNARIHLFAACMVIIAGFVFNLSKTEWLVVVLTIGLVLLAEGVNTAIERLCNVVSKDHHPEIGKVKDIAAGAVLIASIAAAAIGLMVFVPHIVELF